MEEDTMMALDEFLKENGFDSEKLTLKQKRKILKDMLVANGVNQDYEEEQYKKHPSEEFCNEYIDKINNLEVERVQIIGCILVVSKLQKENRRLKRKEALQKVMAIVKR